MGMAWCSRLNVAERVSASWTGATAGTMDNRPVRHGMWSTVGCARPVMLQRERQRASMSLGDAVMHYRAAYDSRSVRTERCGRDDAQKFLLVPSRPAPGTQ